MPKPCKGIKKSYIYQIYLFRARPLCPGIFMIRGIFVDKQNK